jgi:putative endonuclease
LCGHHKLSFVIPGALLGASPESITPVPKMTYYVYLLASKKHGTLYLGVPNDIVRRGYEHRTKAAGGFTARYGSKGWSGSKSATTRHPLLLAKKN